MASILALLPLPTPALSNSALNFFLLVSGLCFLAIIIVLKVSFKFCSGVACPDVIPNTPENSFMLAAPTMLGRLTPHLVYHIESIPASAASLTSFLS